MLYEGFYESCVVIESQRTEDGEGGWITETQEGEEFMAAIVADRTLQARVAESEGMTSIYTVTVPKGTCLGFHTAFKRVSDGKVFRVTGESTDVQTPKMATFSFEQVPAESWEVPQ